MPRVIVDGQQERGIFYKDKHYHFDHEGLCIMDKAEFDILHEKYKYLKNKQEIPDPIVEPEPEIEVEIKVKKEVPKQKRTATKKKG